MADPFGVGRAGLRSCTDQRVVEQRVVELPDRADQLVAADMQAVVAQGAAEPDRLGQLVVFLEVLPERLADLLGGFRRNAEGRVELAAENGEPGPLVLQVELLDEHRGVVEEAVVGQRACRLGVDPSLHREARQEEDPEVQVRVGEGVVVEVDAVVAAIVACMGQLDVELAGDLRECPDRVIQVAPALCRCRSGGKRDRGRNANCTHA